MSRLVRVLFGFAAFAGALLLQSDAVFPRADLPANPGEQVKTHTGYRRQTIASLPTQNLAHDSTGTQTFLVPEDDGLHVYSTVDGRERFRLPPGIITADGQYVTAEPDVVPIAWHAFRDDQTVLKVLDPRTSLIEYSTLVQNLWAVGSASPSARWVALTRVPNAMEGAAWGLGESGETDVQIIDTHYEAPPRVLVRHGDFQVLALGPDGRWLYLLDHSWSQPQHILLRRFDLDTGTQDTAPVADLLADEIEPAGVSSDGKWLALLCVSTAENLAFAELLDLRSGTAIAIDLPAAGGGADRLKPYALQFSPDGRRLFAANAVLGVAADIELADSPVLVQKTGFQVWDYGQPKQYDAPLMSVRSAIAADGATLFFTSGWDVWRYNVEVQSVDGPYLIDGQISGLGLSRDDQHLYAATAAPMLHLLDSRSGDELLWTQDTVEP